MVTTASIAEVAALIGDPSRAAMLQALMGGRALTASELAGVACVTPQTASGHLARLAAAGLVAATRQGRHRYHRLATPQVAQMLESLTLVAGAAVSRIRTGPRDERLRLARTCYDHIAGRLGVGIADALTAEGWIEVEEDAGLITPKGMQRLADLGIHPAPASPRRARAASVCRLCLDWSERRPHLGGRLGAALRAHGLDKGWIRRREGSRALDITPEGRRAYWELFRVETAEIGPSA